MARAASIGALCLVPVACGGSSDADVLSQPTTTATASPVDVSATDAPTVDATQAAVDNTEPAETTPAPSGASFPAGAELAVSFTFTTQDGGGRVHNPYLAVWVEDADGNLVQTLALWTQQTSKGQRWLRDLRAWYQASGGSADTSVSGATRAPGDYTVVWDGTGLDGAPVAQGTYTVYVEGAREHGPYEVTSAELNIGTDGFTVTLPDNGELSALSATLSV